MSQHQGHNAAGRVM